MASRPRTCPGTFDRISHKAPIPMQRGSGAFSLHMTRSRIGEYWAAFAARKYADALDELA